MLIWLGRCVHDCPDGYRVDGVECVARSLNQLGLLEIESVINMTEVVSGSSYDPDLFLSEEEAGAFYAKEKDLL